MSYDKGRIRGTKTLLSIVLILILASAVVASLQFSNAAAPEIQPRAFLSANPNPVGLGQVVDVTIWLQPIPPTTKDYFHGLTVTITKPDGTTETRGPLTTSSIGGQYFQFTPTQLGTYTLKLDYPGEFYTSKNQTYKSAASPETKLIVQQNPIEPFPENPTPTDYWTRPINARNRNWASISGNWLERNYDAAGGSMDSAGAFAPYSQAPRAAHIVWTKELDLGGLTGGEYGPYSYFPGFSYEPKLIPPIIMNGRLYYMERSDPGFVCVDLRTGEKLWHQPALYPFYPSNVGSATNPTWITHGQLLNFNSGNQGGVNAYLWSVQAGSYRMFSAYSGELMVEFANATAGTVVRGSDGTMFVYILNGAANWLTCWNSTKAFEATRQMWISDSGVPAWRPQPGVHDWRKGIQWNVSVPDVPGAQAIVKISDGVIVASVGGGYYVEGSGDGINYIGYSTTTGEQLWSVNNVGHWDSGERAFGQGVFCIADSIKATFNCYDIYTGQHLWESDPAGYPWGVYKPHSPTIAYGKLYAGAYDGYIRAYDLKTGKEVWSFSSGNAGIETPYGTYPMWYGPIVADNVVFIATGEHSPTQPLIKGEKIFALDATTGKELWELKGFICMQAIADGYLVTYNGEDNRIYIFGKGPSETTVSATPKVAQRGSAIMIEGTVTDQSTGQPGTPAIADVDQGAWMEYLKEQMPIPGTAKGVPVTLTAIGPDGGTINIGEVTSDMSGMFKKMWTPPTEGEYTITATFAGTDSYGSSYAETSLGVEPQTVATSSASSTTAGTNIGLPVEAAYAGAIVIVALVVVLVAVILRRKK
ncbi:MAG: PQQ-binding-like beta-propeller repeat protein [Candidatus Bathyarchaeia archaeon]